MLRHIGLVALIVLLVVGVVLPASAGVGFGALLYVGSEKVPWSCRLILKEEGTNRDLFSPTGVVQPAPDRGILAQMTFARDDSKGIQDFKLAWSTMAAPGRNDWHQVEPDPKAGWLFRIDPQEYLRDGPDTWLHLGVIVRRGRKDFVMAILKITYALKDASNRDILVIRPTEPQAEVVATGPQFDMGPINDNFAQLGAAIAKLADGQQRLVAEQNATNVAVVALVPQVDRLGKWADTVTQSQQGTTTTGSWTLRLPPYPTGWALWTSINGRSVKVHVAGDVAISCGVVWVEACPWETGGRWKSWHRVDVKPGQVITLEEVR